MRLPDFSTAKTFRVVLLSVFLSATLGWEACWSSTRTFRRNALAYSAAPFPPIACRAAVRTVLCRMPHPSRSGPLSFHSGPLSFRSGPLSFRSGRVAGASFPHQIHFVRSRRLWRPWTRCLLHRRPCWPCRLRTFCCRSPPHRTASQSQKRGPRMSRRRV